MFCFSLKNRDGAVRVSRELPGHTGYLSCCRLNLPIIILLILIMVVTIILLILIMVVKIIFILLMILIMKVKILLMMLFVMILMSTLGVLSLGQQHSSVESDPFCIQTHIILHPETNCFNFTLQQYVHYEA